MRPEFKNEPMTDFSRPENRSVFQAALQKVAGELGREYPLVLGAERMILPDKIRSINPSRKSQAIGIFQACSPELARKAVEVAHKAFASWSRTGVAERAEYLFKAADIIRQRKHEFSATMVYEVGKSWPEADGDTAEAIDFLEFYGREMLRYAGEQPLTRLPTEDNHLFYIPIGVGAVIPPWNFPLAILVGMTSAAFVTGNTVVLKPSSDSLFIAWKFFQVLEEIGLPPGVVNFMSGPGSTAGNAVVEHPKTRFIAFTGSKEVGLTINTLAAKTQPGQIWIKRVVAEMGGKDTIVVDAEADLDAAVTGVRAAAFGFQGQKCSACSRAVVDASLYDAFLEKLVAQVKQIKVGNPEDPEVGMGPVVNQSAWRSIMNYIEVGKKEGRLVAGGEGSDSEGFFIQPTVIADIAPRARISQEEIFGPVLAVIKSTDFDQALEIANNTEFGLTGAIYSKNEAKLERAVREFHVGNLYLNRKCTGALVGVHPFGGFNMSGTDSKAGGRDYLLLFLQAKCTSRLKS
jgi:1-pyrroline-5-carboxylate dehydrogenase